MCPALTPSCYDMEMNTSMLSAFSRFKHVQFGQDLLGSSFEASITQQYQNKRVCTLLLMWLSVHHSFVRCHHGFVECCE